MNIFDYLYIISLHNAYANAIPVICKSIETIVIILSAMFFIYKMYFIVFIADTTQDTKKQTNTNDNIWYYKEYNSKPVQKEENIDGKCKPESNASNADNKH
jgi:hypothetical protein